MNISLSMGRIFAIYITVLLITPTVSQAEGRWYDQTILENGTQLFQQNCISCHGVNAEGTLDWKTTDSNGKYPPPPLNGTAHAWHHDMDTLRGTIREGGIKLGGTMPPFNEILTADEIDAVIAYFQSKWNDELYQKWAGRFLKTETPSISQPPKIATLSQPGNNELTYWLKKRLGERQFSAPAPTKIDGMYHTEFGSDHAYLSNDGRYIIIGNMIDLKTGQNLTEIAKRKTASSEIAKVKLQSKAIFPAIGAEKAVLNIFTDTSCPYCKKLHAEVPKLQQAGISVMYLPYPRGSVSGPGYQTLKQVWCADNKAEAMDIAKDITTGTLPLGNCIESSMVDKGYELGNKVGVTGTPALFKSNGELISGYVPYDRLIPMVIGSK